MDGCNSRDGQSITRFLIKKPRKTDPTPCKDSSKTNENIAEVPSSPLPPPIRKEQPSPATIQVLIEQLESQKGEQKLREKNLHDRLQKNTSILQETLIQISKQKRLQLQEKIHEDNIRLGSISNPLLSSTDPSSLTWIAGEDQNELKEYKRKIDAIKSEACSKKKNKNKKKASRLSLPPENTEEDLPDPSLEALEDTAASPFLDVCEQLDHFIEKEITSTKHLWLLNEDMKLRLKEAKLSKNRLFHLHRLLLDEIQEQSLFSDFPVLQGDLQLLNLMGGSLRFSEVWEAFSLECYKRRVLKICRVPGVGVCEGEDWRESGLFERMPFVVKVERVFTEREGRYVGVVYEECGGESLDILLAKYGTFSEKEGRIIACQVLTGLQGIVERMRWGYCGNISARNIIYNDGMAMIAEVFPPFLPIKQILHLKYPERNLFASFPPLTHPLKENGHVGECYQNVETDLWCVGNMLYELLFNPSSAPPSESSDLDQKFSSFKNSLTIEFPCTPKVSNECKEFLRMLLDRVEKPNLQTALTHPFLKGV